jgi:hypothetical protein
MIFQHWRAQYKGENKVKMTAHPRIAQIQFPQE